MPTVRSLLAQRRRHWLVTGSAGFIGSHVLEALLRAGQQVTSVDNFSTGQRSNLQSVREAVGEPAWALHRFVQGDLADPELCQELCVGVDVVVHQAALEAGPLSISDPLAVHRANATGFVNLLTAACACDVRRFVYAASSTAYGDAASVPATEDRAGRLQTPAAVSKYVNELYADVFARCYGIETVGLRYFEVFGPRQGDQADGSCARLIPRWTRDMWQGRRCVIEGDGESSRDFCYVGNVVQGTLLAALADNPGALNQVYNMAAGERATLNQLHALIAQALGREHAGLRIPTPLYQEAEPVQLRHALADVGKARRLLGYQPAYTLSQGLAESVSWYVGRVPQVA
ncbi:NAD-dependent epimerase/dehydratase family protein [Aquabacterium sp. A7-Y]|uniref:NAD-dependent epimerase/dehydratase family protein n=1 Tax=Aquabacterium sp. A7-Y TaxID=1349605 RepID=UPI00223E2A97|nr:NAD-dependent epimerase/dehydratase family protein [Aquabacterium sp. A7-Y]MCW7537501.1 NAD-dependent epimerase/dehydratase family protein [Aquabacterium sp. A7-Y]